MRKIALLLFTLIGLSLHAQKELSSTLTESYDGSAWQNSDKIEYSYEANGNVVFMFDHTCNFTIKKEDITMDMEELELELIDFEVEEVFDDEDGIIIYAPFEQYGSIQSFFEENNVEILSSGFERIPTTSTTLNEMQQADVNKLLEKLEEDDDVQNVYHSMQI